MAFVCQQCGRPNLPKKHYQCGKCLNARYCSKECGTAHWFQGNHRALCVGKETETKTTHAIPSFGNPPPKEQAVPKFNLARRLQQLKQEILNIPEPTERERESMEKETRGMNAFEMLCALQQFKEQRKELLIHESLIGFLKDYLSSKNVSDFEIGKILDVLLEAEQKIAKAGFDFIEKDDETTLFEGSALAEAAFVMASTAVLGENPINFSLTQDTEMESIERHCAYAFELAEQVTTLVPMTERNDKLTVALGFDVDEMFLGTEQEIQARIDSGIMTKPDWWDNRMNFLFEPIDGPEPIRGGPKPEDLPPRKKTDLPYAPYPTDKKSKDFRCNLVIAKYMWEKIGHIYGKIPASITKVAEAVVKKVTVDGAIFIINFACISASVFAGTSIYYNYMALDHEKINIFVNALYQESKAIDKTVLLGAETSVVLVQHEKIVEELSKLMENKDVGSFSLLDVRQSMYGEREHILTPWLWNRTKILPDMSPLQIERARGAIQAATRKIEEARDLTELWLRYHMKPFVVAEIPKSAKTFYEVMKLWYADITEYGKNAKEMEETLDYMMKSFSMIFAKTGGGQIESVRDSFKTAQKFIQSLRTSQKLIPKTWNLIHDVYQIKLLHGKTVESAEAVIGIARHSAEHTPALDRLVRDYVKSNVSAFTLHTMRAMLALNQFVIAGTFDTKKAAAFMSKVNNGASVSILEWAMNAPVVSAQAGCYLLCNAYLLQWIVTLIENIENAKDWRPHCLDIFDTYSSMTEDQLKAKSTTSDEKGRGAYKRDMELMYSGTTYFFRFFRVLLFGHGRLLGLTGGLKAAIRYGPILGAAFLYYSYVRYTGAWDLNLRENPLAILQLGPLAAHTAMGFYNNFQTPWDLVFRGIPTAFTGLHYKSSGKFVITSTANFFRRVGDTVFNTHSYKIQQEKQRKKQTSTSYWTFENAVALLIFLGFAWYLAGKIARIGNQPHWPQYQTREDRRKKYERVLVLE